MGFAHCFLISFTYAECIVIFFIKHFLISPILYEGSTLINFSFLINRRNRFKKNYLVSNLNFAELGAKMHFFRKILHFIKSECFDGFFPNLIPNSLENWPLCKVLFSTIASNLRQLERLQTFFKKFKSPWNPWINFNEHDTKGRVACALGAHQILARTPEWSVRYRSLNFPKFEHTHASWFKSYFFKMKLEFWEPLRVLNMNLNLKFRNSKCLPKYTSCRFEWNDLFGGFV